MKRVFALFLTVCAANATTMEPEPDMYSTSMEPEPGMSTPMASTAMASSTAMPSTPMATSTGAPMNTTTTAEVPKHEITMTATLPNLNNFANASYLIAQLTAEVTKSTASGSQVAVAITHMKVVVSYGGFAAEVTQAQANDVVESVQAMYTAAGQTVMRAHITVNNMSHDGTRRLSGYTAEVITTVPNTGGTDVVTKTKALSAANTAQAFQTQISQKSGFADFNATMPAAPAVQIEIKTTVSGQHATPPQTSIGTDVGALLGGTVTVNVVSSGVTSTQPAFEGGDNHAPIAPMMTIWAALYALVMS